VAVPESKFVVEEVPAVTAVSSHRPRIHAANGRGDEQNSDGLLHAYSNVWGVKTAPGDTRAHVRVTLPQPEVFVGPEGVIGCSITLWQPAFMTA